MCVCVCVRARARAKLLQLCLPLYDLIDYRPPGSPIHGLLQVRILEWVAVPSSRGSSLLSDVTKSLMSPALVGEFFTTSIAWEAQFRFKQTQERPRDPSAQSPAAKWHIGGL